MSHVKQAQTKDFVDIEACPTDRFAAIVNAVNAGAYDAETVGLLGETLDEVAADYTQAIRSAYNRDGGLNWEACDSKECLECAECIFTLDSNARKYLEQAARTYTSMLDRYMDLMKVEAISGEATEQSRRKIAEYSMLAYECANRIKILSL